MACYKPALIDLETRRGNKAEEMNNQIFTCSKCGESEQGQSPHCKCERKYEQMKKREQEFDKIDSNHRDRLKRVGLERDKR